jgi:hypothetical protein
MHILLIQGVKLSNCSTGLLVDELRGLVAKRKKTYRLATSKLGTNLVRRARLPSNSLARMQPAPYIRSRQIFLNDDCKEITNHFLSTVYKLCVISATDPTLMNQSVLPKRYKPPSI